MGKGSYHGDLGTNRAVHPRVCGEQQGAIFLAHGHDGSSPRVRGTGPGHEFLHEYGRFIPACAGNSTTVHGWYRVVTVHPRVCGEQTSISESAFLKSGSSPRVRGTDHAE